MKSTQIVIVLTAIALIGGAILITGPLLIFDRTLAAPPPKIEAQANRQTAGDNLTYLAVSSMAFMPVNQNEFYRKDTGRQILTVNNQARPVAGSNIFVTPLTLPDRSRFIGMTVFGEDFDNQGAVRIRLKRCDHGQPRCVTLAEAGSADSYAGGPFDTGRISMAGEQIDNNLYSYFLELDLTAIFNSGLRSVRLETVAPSGDIAATPNPVQQWMLSGPTTSFPLPNTGWTEVRVCTNDLSHLNNATHYPMLVVDGQTTVLSSNTCITEQGIDIEIRRRLNTGPSSGTYQFLR